jgi:hypothetical protein
MNRADCSASSGPAFGCLNFVRWWFLFFFVESGNRSVNATRKHAARQIRRQSLELIGEVAHHWIARVGVAHRPRLPGHVNTVGRYRLEIGDGMGT